MSFRAFLVFLLACPAAVRAADGVSGVCALNPGGAIIAAHETDGDPATNFHLIQGEAAGVPGVAGNYRAVFSLKTESGGSVLLDNGAGGTTTALVSPPQTAATAASAIALHLGFSPAGALDPQARYRVSATVQRQTGPTSWVNVGAAGNGPLQHFYTFTNDATDPPLNAFATADSLTLAKPVIVRSVAGEEDFTVAGTVTVTRLDDLDAAPATDTIPLTFTLSMESTDPVPVPVALAVPAVQVEVPVDSHDGSGGPVTVSAPFALHVAPADWNDLLPTTGYRLKVSLSHTEPDTTETSHFTDRLVTAGTTRLFAFSGDLYFGGTHTLFTAVTNDPAAGGVIIPNNTLETSLTIPAGNGTLAENAGTTRRFGGAPMEVWIEPGAAGHLVFFRGLGQMAFSTVDTDLETVSGVRVVRTTMRLNQNGLIADLFGVFFPSGFGYTANEGGRRLHSVHAFPDVPCGQDLLPLSGTLSIPGPVYAVHESLPVKMQASQIDWDRAAGTFTIPAGSQLTYVRSAEDAMLPSPPLTNDGYFRAARDLQSDAVILADANGRALIQSATLGLTDGAFRSHFPQNAEIGWDGAGTLVIENGRISPAASGLTQPRTLLAVYQRGCPKDPCGVSDPATVSVTPAEGSLRFTPDGGLKLNGDLPAPEELRWGKNGATTYAHRTEGFEKTSFHMPGTVLRAAENDRTLRPGEEPAALLLAGMGAEGDEALTERPGTPPPGMPDTYLQGNADYAGLNFRRTTQGAWSRLGASGGDIGSPGAPYPLHAAAKYYARFGGVSGRHQAVRPAPGAPSAFSSVFLYGFKCSLSGIALGYLDSENVFSAVGGGIHVPGDIPGLNGNPAAPPGIIIEPLPPGMTRGPAGFDQGFAALTFHCDGRPNKAELDGTAPHFLEYWNVWFQPLTFAFASKVDGAACPLPGQGALTMGASVFIPSITSVKPQATFTFKNNGNLVTRAEAASYQVQDALLTIPPEMPVNGPGNVPYKLATRGKAYLNNPAAPGAPTGIGEGWINLYGALDVPYFRDVKVHLHIQNPSAPGTPAVANPNASTWIMGGWASHDALPSPYAWTEAGSPARTPFNHDAFDASQHGFTGTLAGYRQPAVAPDANATPYLPRAQQEWLEVFRMDYAMRYNAETKAFTGIAEPEGELLVIKARHRLLNLNSSIAEITFGAKYEGLPVLNVNKVLSDAATGAVDGALSALTSAGMDATGLTDAVNSMDRLLATGLNELIEAKLGAAIDGVTAGIPVSTMQTWSTTPPDVSSWTSAIKDLAKAPTGAIDTAGGFVQEMDARLAQVDGGLGAILAFLPSDAQIAAGQGPIRTLTVNMLDQVLGGNPIGDAIAANLIDVVIPNGIEPELKRAGPALAEVRSSVLKVRAAVQQARASLQSGSGLLREIDAALNMSAVFETTVRNELQAWVAMTPGTLAERGETWARAEIRRLVLRRFYADSGAAKLQGTLRYHFTSVRQSFRGALDGLLGEVNRTIRDGVYKALNSLKADLGLDKFAAGAGQVSESFGAAAIEGYARIAGDSIDKLRIDAKMRLRAADDFEFKGWLEVNALNAKSPRAKCYCDNPNEMRDGAEIRIGGEAPLTFMSEGTGQDEDNARIRVEGMFAFGACGPPGTPTTLLGLGGSLEMKGELNVGGVTIQEVGFIFSFGEASNYFGAKARADFKGYECAVALFIGASCGAEPLRFVDPAIGSLLTHPKIGVLQNEAEIESTLITGIYIYSEAWMPLNEVLGIPTTCFLAIRAGIGAGPFAFKVDRPGKTVIMAGGKQFIGFNVDLLCIASATAELRMTGAVSLDVDDPPPTEPGVMKEKPFNELFIPSAEDIALRLLGTATFTIEICALVCIEFSKDIDFYAQLRLNDVEYGLGN